MSIENESCFNYLIIDKHISKKGDIISLNEVDNKISTTHFTGINTDNYIIKKSNGKNIEFSFFKLNGIYYININGHHMIDYKKFVNIQQISKINEDDIKIKNIYVGDIILYNCDIDIVHKALDVMARFMNDKKSFVIDLMYHIFH